MGETPDRLLAKCEQCGHPTLAHVSDGAIAPISNTPGTRCPTCGGAELSTHPLVEE